MQDGVGKCDRVNGETLEKKAPGVPTTGKPHLGDPRNVPRRPNKPNMETSAQQRSRRLATNSEKMEIPTSGRQKWRVD